MLDYSVWKNKGENTLSRRSFYGLIGLCLTWGFVLAAIASRYTATWEPNIWAFLFIGLAIPIFGIVISSKSTNPVVSFIGFNLVVIPIGAMLGPILHYYAVTDPEVIQQALLATAYVTAMMTISAFLFPKFYSKMGGALFMGLICVLILLLLQLFIPAMQNWIFISYLTAGIFALYIGYDIWRASVIPATLDNAIDVSVSLYLDIVNLFMSLLRIFGR
jgi:FtsH-binding integral membrane protein